jgi:hypothetical protein
LHIDIVGADFKAFLKDAAVWQTATYWDDTRIGLDGVFAEDDPDFSAIPDDTVVRVESGFITNAPVGVPEDLIDCLRWWLGRQQSVRLVITFPKAVQAQVVAALSSLGVVVGGSA